MTDYTHIPIHIRCTERWKIDPRYPEDGCKWWVGVAEIEKLAGGRRPQDRPEQRIIDYMTPLEAARDPWLKRQAG